MKTKILSFLVALGVSSGAMASTMPAFNGFGAGASIGYVQNKYHANAEGQTLRKNALPVGIFLNWMTSAPNGALFAVEANVSYDFGAEKKANILESDPSKGYYKIIKGITTMFTGKVGWNCDNKWIAYALFGVGGTNFKTKVHTSTSDSESSDYHFLIAPGAGFEIDLDSVRVGVEYKYVMHTKRVSHHKVGTADADLHLRPRAHDVRLRVSVPIG